MKLTPNEYGCISSQQFDRYLAHRRRLDKKPQKRGPHLAGPKKLTWQPGRRWQDAQDKALSKALKRIFGNTPSFLAPQTATEKILSHVELGNQLISWTQGWAYDNSKFKVFTSK
jgi:hypothetical protein